MLDVDIASLGIKIDSTEAKTATGNLDSMAKAGERAEDSLAGVQKAGAGAAQGIAKADKAAVDASKSIAKTGDAGKGLDAAKKSADQLAKALEDVKSTASKSGSLADTLKLPAVRASVSQTATSLGTVSSAAAAAASSTAKILVPSSAADGFRGLGQAAASAERSASGLADSSSRVAAVLSGAGLVYAVSQFIRYADVATMVSSQLRLVTTSSENLVSVQGKLFDISQTARVGFAQLAGTYAQIARATDGLGISQERLLNVVGTISKAITISGGAASSSQAALVQLSQGLASGTLRGEELNSILEQTPRLAQGIAQGLGVSVGRLREMGAAGELTSERIVGALEKAAGRIDKEFGGVALTVSQSFTQLQNSAVSAIGEIDKASGVSNALAHAVSAVASSVSGVGSALKESPLAADLLSGAAGAVAGAAAVGGVALALGAIRTALLGIATVAAANPVILALLGIGAAAGYLGSKYGTGDDIGMSESLEAMQKRRDFIQKNIARGRLDAEQLANNQAMLALIDRRLSGANGASAAAEGFSELERSIVGAEEAASKAAASAKSGARSKWLKEYATDAEKLSAEIKKASEDFGGNLPADIEQRIRAKFAKKPSGTGLNIDRAAMGFDIEEIRNQLQTMTTAFANAESILEATRSAGLIDERDYYAAKRGFLEANSALQVQALRDENARIAEENKALQKAGLADPTRAAEAINNRKKIADNNARIGMIESTTLAKTTVLTIQQQAALDRVTASYLSARQAAQQYIDTLNRQQDRALEGVGQGQKRRDYNDGVNQIEDRYASQRLELENNKALLEAQNSFGAEARAQYQNRLALIDEFQAASLASYEKYYASLQSKNEDWTTGASEATYNYLDDARNVAKQTDALFTDAFYGIEDALVSFAKTGKLNFKSLADSIISDIIRMQAKAALSSILGSSGLGSIVSNLFGGAGAGIGSATAADVGAAGDGLMFLADGGYTGDGGKYEPAGLVHRGEYVLNAPATKALGKGLLDRLNGFANGGFVGNPTPAILSAVPSQIAAMRNTGQSAAAPVQVEIVNNGQPARAKATTSMQPDGTQLVRIVLDAIGESIADGVGPVPRALEGRYGLERSMGY
jgi:lambda family phage tail tape measure protein